MENNTTNSVPQNKNITDDIKQNIKQQVKQPQTITDKIKWLFNRPFNPSWRNRHMLDVIRICIYVSTPIVFAILFTNPTSLKFLMDIYKPLEYNRPVKQIDKTTLAQINASQKP